MSRDNSPEIMANTPEDVNDTTSNQSTQMVHISADEFGEVSPLDSINDKWLVNLSDVELPKEVQYLLQLGEGFGLPIDKGNIDRTLVEFIKHIENNIYGRPNNVVNFFRNKSIPFLDKIKNEFPKFSSTDKLLSDWFRISKEFVNSHPEILISIADKGNVTVVLDRSEYVAKMEMMLSDIDTYSKIDKDPTKKLIGDIRNLLVRWKNRQYIDDTAYRRLLATDGSIPRAYGLTKIHKPGHPLRIIVSSINSPLYNLSYYLHKIINDNIPETPSSIKNSFDLINKVKNVNIDEGYSLVSFDVVSLFTNVPIELATDSVVGRWEFISGKTKIPLDEFLIAFRLVLNSTYFVFNKVIYKQIFGTPMGSPLSPVVANMVMQDLEKKAIDRLPCRLLFYYSYVGQTKRRLQTRVQEHISDINKTSKSPSVISNHRLVENHDFRWDDVKVLDIEPSYNKRLISEMVHIKRQRHGIKKRF
ncbi:PREDICTED: uncharacterized protein LOC108764709 [Trachymyrmex cornetzi]|uniref:uncharacterized protein LOC108764709 n=1 Tax=Trachymyrmex cornetzi TaxID=471704 RepID=UPI00084F7C84|nr:PREDICTED: uncharacterized protein LOC108764709 [Trachymyrmex cornetzi]